MLTPTGSISTPRDQNRLTQVGNICAQWSNLEYLFAITIWRFLGLDMETGKIVTGGLDMLPRANMAINLAKHLKAPREITTALTTTRKAIQDGLDTRRNRAVHGVRFQQGDDLWVEVHRGAGGRNRQHLPDEELVNLGKEIHNVAFDLHVALVPFMEGQRLAMAAMLAQMRRAAAEAVSDEGS